MKRRNWYRLDNTAKIMPSTTTYFNTNVFRLYCTLSEDVDKKVLQEALDKSLLEFPLFLYTMKDGLFWHYLEESNYKPKVREESAPICSAIDQDFLIRVTYYKKRVNLEVYHVLADGNGAMEFLKYLICTYLSKKYKLEVDIPLNDTSVFEKEKDDFQTFDKSSFKISASKVKRAYRIKLQKKDNVHHDVIEMKFGVKDTKEAAKKHNTSLTVYLTALYIKSIIDNAKVKDLKRPIGITLPVDLRNIFPSKTSRNFFYTILVSYQPNETNELSEIIDVITKQMQEQLDKNNLQKKMNTFMLIEKVLFIRMIPGFIKDIGLKYIAKMGKIGQTSVFSNLGLVKVPECYMEYIDEIGTISSTDDIQLVASSFKEQITLCFSSHFANKEIERSYLKYLKNDIKGDIKIVSNVGSDSYE